VPTRGPEESSGNLMTYVDSMLAGGERIVRRDRQHWLVLLWGSRVALGAIGVALALLVVRAVSDASGALMDALGILTFVLFAGGLAVLFWNVLRYRNEEYVITSRRIIHAEGVVNKRATDSSLEKINDAILSESLFGRLLGFGDLDVLTASESGIERLRMLRNAKAFKKAMLEAKHDLELELSRPVMPPARAAGTTAPEGGRDVAAGVGMPGAASGGSAAPTAPDAPGRGAHRSAMTPDDVTAALARLGDLRDRGVLTPEEFEAKKRELLDRL
jgi:hypothetical protein